MPIKVFLNKHKVLKYVKSMCNHLGIRSNFYKFCCKLINSAQRIGLACQARELLNDRYSFKTIESQREAFHYILFLSDFTHPQSTRRKKNPTEEIVAKKYFRLFCFTQRSLGELSANEKIGPQCVHVWLTKLSCFLVSGVSLGFY